VRRLPVAAFYRQCLGTFKRSSGDGVINGFRQELSALSVSSFAGELKSAFTGSAVRFGLYFCQTDFLHPTFLADQSRNYSTTDYMQVTLFRW
jgi:hypothetical protein